jgi:hypothetical protein
MQTPQQMQQQMQMQQQIQMQQQMQQQNANERLRFKMTVFSMGEESGSRVARIPHPSR